MCVHCASARRHSPATRRGDGAKRQQQQQTVTRASRALIKTSLLFICGSRERNQLLVFTWMPMMICAAHGGTHTTQSGAWNMQWIGWVLSFLSLFVSLYLCLSLSFDPFGATVHRMHGTTITYAPNFDASACVLIANFDFDWDQNPDMQPKPNS